MSSATLRLRFRPDLAARRILFGDRECWVVRDPVAGRFFYFNPGEYKILTTLDGRRSLQELLDETRRSRPDEYLSADGMIRFLAEARKSGLLIARNGDAAPSDTFPKARKFQPLSSRWPLFNPQQFLNAITPSLGFLFSKPCVIAYALLVISALISVIVRFEDFTERLPAVSAWLTPGMVIVVAAVLFVCKLIHELAHGVFATRFGARVEECGVLFLFFIPCFYCDVSDAWMFRSRAQRMLVSAAGMLAELGMAAVAIWLWWFSNPGPVQAICLAVMMTCSINTLLINGNPLMRFDGYFVLVDMLGLPNLSARGTQWWSAFWNHWVWGLPSGSSEENDWRCGLYGLLAGVYRVVVVVGVLWFLHRAGKAYGLEGVTLAFAILTLGGLAVRTAKTVARPLSDSLLRRMMRPARVMTALATVGAVCLLAALVPLPRTVEADFVLEPLKASPVFAAAPGRLVSLLPAGAVVKEGDEIAVLENRPLERELVEVETEEKLTAARLQSARLRRNSDPEAAQTIPSLVESLAAISERKRLLQRDVDDLTIRAGVPGLLLPPPNVVSRTHDSKQPEFWTGTPFDQRNRDCYLERGTLLAQIASDDKLSAVAYVSQRDVEKLRLEQTVRLAVDGAGDRRMEGSVSEISPAPVERIARELVAGRSIAVRPDDSRGDVPLEPYYRVRIELIAGGHAALPGGVGSARIEVAPASLLSRFMQAARDAFQFDVSSPVESALN